MNIFISAARGGTRMYL